MDCLISQLKLNGIFSSDAVEPVTLCTKFGDIYLRRNCKTRPMLDGSGVKAMPGSFPAPNPGSFNN